MDFDPTKYGPEVARLLAMDQNGQTYAPLVCRSCTSREARKAWACLEEAHHLIDEAKTEFGIRPGDALACVEFGERARLQPGSVQEKAAVEIQRAEWQFLLDHSARPQ